MKAILFGSIGTLVETSELQREAFNMAFNEYGLKWQWDQTTYQSALANSGGLERIARYAKSVGEEVDAKSIHETKTQIFQRSLDERLLSLRDGVDSVLTLASENGLKTAFVSTTDLRTVERLKSVVSSTTQTTFDIVTSVQNGFSQKPAPDAYLHVLDQLNVKSVDAVVIEDNVAGVKAANSAGCFVIAFPGQNTLSHDYRCADLVVGSDLFSQVKKLISTGS